MRTMWENVTVSLAAFAALMSFLATRKASKAANIQANYVQLQWLMQTSALIEKLRVQVLEPVVVINPARIHPLNEPSDNLAMKVRRQSEQTLRQTYWRLQELLMTDHGWQPELRALAKVMLTALYAYRQDILRFRKGDNIEKLRHKMVEHTNKAEELRQEMLRWQEEHVETQIAELSVRDTGIL